VGEAAEVVEPGGTHARILRVVRSIPRGRVATYGQVAALAGLPRQARLVGYALHALRDGSRIPWQRVINAKGEVSPRADGGHDRLQRAMLEKEGVRFDAKGRVDLKRHRFRPRAAAPLALGLVALLLASACVGVSAGTGRLAARPHAASLGCPAGLQRLGVDPERETLLYVPASVSAATPAPLVVWFHGAGGKASRGVDRLRAMADADGVLLLAPQSLDPTWDGIHGTLGPDVARLDRALALAFDRCAVDPRRLAAAGFSDGASYALTIGLANGDLFSRIVAFSPCRVTRTIAPVGQPAIFLSHGRADDVLPIEDCGRRLASGLTRSGYSVRYEEFDGRHEIPSAIAQAAFRWLAGAAP
jgi:phospholipase/carboxylesterase